MQASAIQSRTIMQGEYELLEPSPGSAGDVVPGRCRRDGRSVSVRLWRGQSAITPERVLEKPQIAGRLQHPMLAAVEACGRESDGTWFIVSEDVPGKPLREWADEVGIPPLSSVVDFVHRLCQALGSAHREGLAHDALTPANVMVFQQDAGNKQRMGGKILEIGAPAFMLPSPPTLQAAQFMAPEQLAAYLRPDGVALNADARMNVYSCGCLLYFLCTGGAPNPSRTLEELAQAHLEGKLVPPSKINPQIASSLETVILRALAPQRSERHVNVAELATALARVRLTTSASGVRPRVEAAASVAKPAKSMAFDERPTSASRLPSSWPPRTMPPRAAESASSAPDRVEAAIHTVRPPSDVGASTRESWETPAGSFSSAPPIGGKAVPAEARQAAAARAAFSSSVPPVRPPMPRRPPPISALATPVTPELSAKLFTATDEPNRPGLPVLVAEHETPGSYMMGRYSYGGELTPRAARMGSTKIWLGVAAAAACCAVAFWSLDRNPPQAAPSEPNRPEAAAIPAAAPAAPAAVAKAGDADSSEAAKVAREPTEPPGGQAAAGLAPQPAVPEAREIEPEAIAEDEPARRAGASASRARAHRAARAAAARRGIAGQRAVMQSDEAEADELAEQDEPASSAAAESSAQSADVEPQRTPTPPAPRDAGPAPRKESAQQPQQAVEAGSVVSPAPKPKLPLAAAARIDSVVVRGSLATSVVSRAVERIRPQLTACYARAAAAAGHNGFGEVVVEVTLDERGRAQSPRATGGALPGLAACVAEAASKLASDRPPDTGTVKASWKVVFAP
jgi:serine/threonine protein kinase